MSRAKLPTDGEIARLRLLMAFMVCGLAVLVLALWSTQVAHGGEYRKDLMKQSVRRVRIPAQRGRIYDRNGVVLAENRPGYSIALYLEELRPRRGHRGETTLARVRETMEEIQARIGLPPKITEEDIRSHMRRRLPLPLVAWRDIPEAAVARWAEAASNLPGVDIYVEPVRVYPQHQLLCHVLGYVGALQAPPQSDDPDEVYHYRLPEFEGRSGLEKMYEPALHGMAGGRLVPVDVAGFRRRDLDRIADDAEAGAPPPASLWSGFGKEGGDVLRRALRAERREPQSGRDLQLSVDVRVQKLAETALGGLCGAVVVLDPRSGDILAMASAPGYDPNAFTPSIPRSLWAGLLENPDLPLINRATTAAYAPGSIFKPVVALAALEQGIPPTQTRRCDGVFKIGNQSFRCWDALGHGTVDMRRALCQSCNVFFYETGMAVGADAIAAMARELGLGAVTGVDCPPESAGLVPDPEWKRRVQSQGWTPGDTANYSIGQGFLKTTPLQMAVMAAAIANGGTVYRPRFVIGQRAMERGVFSKLPPEVVRVVPWPADHLRAVREGMEAVVMAEDGTGRRIRVPGVTMAGKTGTAEYGPRDSKKKRGWMIAYAPADHPRYAAAMMIEDAVSGGLTVAPRLQVLFNGLFHPEPAPGEESSAAGAAGAEGAG